MLYMQFIAYKAGISMSKQQLDIMIVEGGSVNIVKTVYSESL